MKKYRVRIAGRTYVVEVEELGRVETVSRVEEVPSKRNVIVSPITGRVVEVRVKPGDRVSKGDVVVVLESMKTLVEVRSDREGVIGEVLVKEGDSVRTDQPIARLSTPLASMTIGVISRIVVALIVLHILSDTPMGFNSLYDRISSTPFKVGRTYLKTLLALMRARKLISKDGRKYTITDTGRMYLRTVASEVLSRMEFLREVIS